MRENYFFKISRNYKIKSNKKNSNQNKLTKK